MKRIIASFLFFLPLLAAAQSAVGFDELIGQLESDAAVIATLSGWDMTSWPARKKVTNEGVVVTLDQDVTDYSRPASESDDPFKVSRVEITVREDGASARVYGGPLPYGIDPDASARQLIRHLEQTDGVSGLSVRAERGVDTLRFSYAGKEPHLVSIALSGRKGRKPAIGRIALYTP